MNVTVSRARDILDVLRVVQQASKILLGPRSRGNFRGTLLTSTTQGDPIDERGPIKTEHYLPIHAEAPSFTEQS